MESVYSLGNCIICGKNKPLKDGRCIECQNKADMPDIFKDIFKPFMGDNKEFTKK